MQLSTTQFGQEPKMVRFHGHEFRLKRQRQINQPASNSVFKRLIQIMLYFDCPHVIGLPTITVPSRNKTRKLLYVFQGDFPQDLLADDIFSEFIII